MTDAQLYTAIGVPILGLIFAEELSAGLNRRIDDTKETLRAGMQRDHSEVMAKFADIERRLDRPKTSVA